MSSHSFIRPKLVNTLRPRQNGCHFADDIFKCILLTEDVWIPNKISLKFVPKGQNKYIPSLVQIMAWRRPGDKPLSEPMMVSSLRYICVTRPQWIKWSVNVCLIVANYLLRKSNVLRMHLPWNQFKPQIFPLGNLILRILTGLWKLLWPCGWSDVTLSRISSVVLIILNTYTFCIFMLKVTCLVMYGSPWILWFTVYLILRKNKYTFHG